MAFSAGSGEHCWAPDFLETGWRTVFVTATPLVVGSREREGAQHFLRSRLWEVNAWQMPQALCLALAWAVFLILFSGWNVNWKIEKGLQEQLFHYFDSLLAVYGKKQFKFGCFLPFSFFSYAFFWLVSVGSKTIWSATQFWSLLYLFPLRINSHCRKRYQ